MSCTTHSAVMGGKGGCWVKGLWGVCGGGTTPGYQRLLSPPLPPHRPLSYSPCCRQQPRGIAQRERETKDEVREGSQAGLTLWPPMAGAEAATHPASLRKGIEGSVTTNTSGRLRMYILYLLNTYTLTSIKGLCSALETGTYMGKS